MADNRLGDAIGVARAREPSLRERSANALQDALEAMRMDRYRARKIAQTIAGGESSNLPLSMGLLDPTPIGTLFQRQEAPESAPNMPNALAHTLPALKPSTQAMDAVGYERGWYRGGPAPVDNRMSGPWLTRVPEEAADYAKRFGAGSDVREYAIPKTGMLKLDRDYDQRLASDLAEKAAANFGEQGKKLATLIRSSYKVGERPTGMELWRSASKTLGDDAASELFGSLGFKSVLGVNSPDYVRLFPTAKARDANKAKFDPSKLHLDNIMAGVGGLGLLGAAAIRSRDDE